MKGVMKSVMKSAAMCLTVLLAAAFGFGGCDVFYIANPFNPDFLALPQQNPHVYVDARAVGDGTGTDWDNAFPRLQAAIDYAAAEGYAEVWVAEGIYYPDPVFLPGGSTVPDQTAAFALQNGVAVYGGFAGTERIIQQRDPAAHPVILSGDYAGDDDVTGSGATLSITNTADNAKRIFYHPSIAALDETAVLDGVVIQGGYSPTGADAVDGSGGGMFNIDSSPTVRNCTFRYNSMSYGAGYGGAVYNGGTSAPVFEDCSFTRNLSVNDGGAVYYDAGTTVVLEECIFSGNLAGTTADGDGGAVCVNTAEPESRITGCTFSGNALLGNYFAKGAGLYVTTTTISVIDTDFTDNVIDPPDSSDFGGAVYLHHTPRAVFTGCTFTGHTAGRGGAVYGNQILSPTALYFDRCVFSGNTVEDRGGAIYIHQADLILLNSLITGNAASGDTDNRGGGVYVLIQDAAINMTRLFNSNFVKNHADTSGGGLYIEVESMKTDPVLGNCIFWQNTANSGLQITVGGQIGNFEGKMFSCIVQDPIPPNDGINPSDAFTSGYIDEDPLFVDAAGGDYNLRSGSPAREGGTNSVFDESVDGDLNGDGDTSDGIADFFDFAGNPRHIGTNVDIGMYEY